VLWELRERRDQRAKHLTFPAKSHLLVPTLLGAALAYGTVDEPAEASGLELPNNAFLSDCRTTVHLLPTWSDFARRRPFEVQKEQELTLDVQRDVSPGLFEALHRFGGDTQQLGYLLLGLVQIAANLHELLAIHRTIRLAKW
jgi:hypothetical protein